MVINKIELKYELVRKEAELFGFSRPLFYN